MKAFDARRPLYKCRPPIQLGVLVLVGLISAARCSSLDDGKMPTSRHRCSVAKQDASTPWGGWATVTIGAMARGSRELHSISFQECSAEGVCQWIGGMSAAALEAGKQPVSISTERGLAGCWYLVATARFRPAGFWDLFGSRKSTTEATVGANSQACAAPGGCIHDIGSGTTVLIQVTYHEPYTATPLEDRDLKLLGANFSAYAVKEFPFSSWIAPLHGQCLKWSLVAEHHDCKRGAHAGTWMAEKEPGHHMVVVAFKGTDFARAEEVITDLQMLLEPCSLGQDALPGPVTVGSCASGFLQAYKSVRVSIMESLEEVSRLLGANSPSSQANKLELLITGHSLGGTMATLMLADVLSDPESFPLRPSQTVVMHYGSPMVGDAAFRDQLWGLEQTQGKAINLRDHVRLVSTNSRGTSDFITHYPKCVPSVWGTHPELYRHVGRRSYIAMAGDEAKAVEGGSVPKSRLMGDPGVLCMTDLLSKGANWLHDERDNYLPMAKSHAMDMAAELRETCSGRTGDSLPNDSPSRRYCRSNKLPRSSSNAPPWQKQGRRTLSMER